MRMSNIKLRWRNHTVQNFYFVIFAAINKYKMSDIVIK